jgi:hypothetical protein
MLPSESAVAIEGGLERFRKDRSYQALDPRAPSP